MHQTDSQEPPIKALFFRHFTNDHIPEILDEIYLKKVYAPFLSGKKDLTIVDIGANQGITVAYFLPFAKEIFAFEPAKMHQEVLQKLCDYNHLSSVKIMPYAVSNANGTTTFFHSPNPTSFSLTNIAGAPKEEQETVETITMEKLFTLCKIKQIDLLKLDAEGEEAKIVCSESFATCAPFIKLIVGEWHQWTQGSKELFEHTLEDLGYEFKWNLTTQASTFYAIRL